MALFLHQLVTASVYFIDLHVHQSISVSLFPPLSLFPPNWVTFFIKGGINWVCETAPQAKNFWGPTHPVYSPPYWVTFFIKGRGGINSLIWIDACRLQSEYFCQILQRFILWRKDRNPSSGKFRRSAASV